MQGMWFKVSQVNKLTSSGIVLVVNVYFMLLRNFDNGVKL